MFADVYKEAHKYGLRTACHAGENSHPDDVREAIEYLGVERIGHGVAAWDQPLILGMAKKAKVTFELCPTSNLHTGAIHDLSELKKIMDSGVRYAICTDNPVISHTTLQQEYDLVADKIGIKYAQQSLIYAEQAKFDKRGKTR
jgi:adenosine deaminase